MSKRELMSLLSNLLPYVNGQKKATALTVVLLLSLSHGAFAAPHLHVVLPVSSHTLTVPIDYVSRIHFKVQDATTVCGEIPHPDDDYLPGHLWVNSVTGGPNEFSPVRQVNFTVAVLMPWRTPESQSVFRREAAGQTRALGAMRQPPSKMRGRS